MVHPEYSRRSRKAGRQGGGAAGTLPLSRPKQSNLKYMASIQQGMHAGPLGGLLSLQYISFEETKSSGSCSFSRSSFQITLDCSPRPLLFSCDYLPLHFQSPSAGTWQVESCSIGPFLIRLRVVVICSSQALPEWSWALESERKSRQSYCMFPLSRCQHKRARVLLLNEHWKMSPPQ